MHKDMVLVHKDHTDSIDFEDGQHLRIGLGVKGLGEDFTGLTVEECAELALALAGSQSRSLNALRLFCIAAARWGVAHPEKLLATQERGS